jgi:hypothetical protein
MPKKTTFPFNLARARVMIFCLTIHGCYSAVPNGEKSRDICFGIVFFYLRSMIGIEDEEIKYQNDIKHWNGDG